MTTYAVPGKELTHTRSSLNALAEGKKGEREGTKRQFGVGEGWRLMSRSAQ